MAELTGSGSVRARCPSCSGALTTFEWHSAHAQYGVVEGAPFRPDPRHNTTMREEWRLMRCAGCGRGALAALVVDASEAYGRAGFKRMLDFYPESGELLRLPERVPEGIKAEFREAESCLAAKCWRAAAGMFRSVLDKTLRANGYKVKSGTTLEQQIDLAAADGVITAARQRRAHEDIRVLGNDVLHDEWRPLDAEDVKLAHQYAQRILEDFYDDRETTLAVLLAKGRSVTDVPRSETEAPSEAANERVSRAPKPIKPLGT